MSYIDTVQTAFNNQDLNTAAAVLEQNKAAHGHEADFAVASATLALYMGSTQQAMQTLEQALQNHPDHGGILYSLGSINYQLNKPQTAYLYYQRAKQHIDDEGLLSQIEALSNDLIRQHGASTEQKGITTISKAQLEHMDFNVNSTDPEQLHFLVNRLDFGKDVDGSIAQLRQAIADHKITKERVLQVVGRPASGNTELEYFIKERL